MNRRAVAVAVLALGALAIPAHAQFDTPASTPVAERIAGTYITGANGVTPEAGDQIGAFDSEGVAGVFQFDASGSADFDLKIYGDDPATVDVKEGPRLNERLTFRFYDASTNSEFEVVAINSSGEKINLTFQGVETPDLPIELPGLDLTPTRIFDMTEGTAGGGGGGGGDPDTAQYDVNGDGKVNTEDAALVLRAVMRGSSAVGEGVDADVNGDGQVTTADAIAVLQNRS